MEKFNRLIRNGINQGFSDLHLTGGHPLVYRDNGVIGFDKEVKWKHEEIDELVKEILSLEQMQILQSRLSVDLAITVHNARLRINVFNAIRGLSLAIRLLPGVVPSIEDLNLHPSLKKYCEFSSGLILICGATGCGKSATIAAMIEEINHIRPAHIITLEDPIEFRFLSRRSFIEQRELGAHIPSFYQGLLDVLREDPDVIMIGELREPDTMRLTLNAAESGHLVLASLHASNSEDAIYRYCNSFPPEARDGVSNQLSSTMALLVVQQLTYLNKINFRVPVISILVGTQGVKGIIRENRLSQIESAIQTGRGKGMFTMQQYKTEYIDTRDKFTPPSVNFRPSAEATPEIVYNSPLVSQRIPVPTPEKPSLKIQGKDGKANGKERATTNGHYVISEELSMDEVIAQLDRPNKPSG